MLCSTGPNATLSRGIGSWPGTDSCWRCDGDIPNSPKRDPGRVMSPSTRADGTFVADLGTILIAVNLGDGTQRLRLDVSDRRSSLCLSNDPLVVSDESTITLPPVSVGVVDPAPNAG